MRDTLSLSDRADFCVGYFNLRGWKQLDAYVERWAGGDGHCCRLLVGMQRLPQEELRAAMSLAAREDGIDNQAASRLKKKLAEEFREQLIIGAPTNADVREARAPAAAWRHEYDHHRPHSSLGYLPPAAFASVPILEPRLS